MRAFLVLMHGACGRLLRFRSSFQRGEWLDYCTRVGASVGSSARGLFFTGFSNASETLQIQMRAAKRCSGSNVEIGWQTPVRSVLPVVSA